MIFTEKSNAYWLSPADEGVMNSGEVHLWTTTLDLPVAVVRNLAPTLSADEIDRAARYVFARDRHRFIVARYCLRRLLGMYLRLEPRDVEIRYNEYGKPFMPASGNRKGITFNLAHSGGFAIYGLAIERQIGVDLEEIRTDFQLDDLARKYFSRQEAATFGSLPPALRANAFFDCWTRKEAFVKALGVGLSLDLSQFDVSFGPGESPSILRTTWNPDEALRWSLVAIEVDSRYAAAVAIEGRVERIGLANAAESFFSGLNAAR